MRSWIVLAVVLVGLLTLVGVLGHFAGSHPLVARAVRWPGREAIGAVLGSFAAVQLSFVLRSRR